MKFRFVVECEVQRNEGKFATRDELADQIRDAIESADPGSLEGDNGGSYETCGWDVSEETVPKPKRARKPRKPTLTLVPPPVDGGAA